VVPLPRELQLPFEEVFGQLLRRVHATAKRRSGGKVDEVDWIEKFHALVRVDLEDGLRGAVRSEGGAFSVAVGSALVHGIPFNAWPRWAHRTARSIEIGDLLLVAELRGTRLELVDRQALLLQMKVGKPTLGGPVTAAKAQAELYATWPHFNWSEKLRNKLPGPFPRTPWPGPSAAAQFGIIPPEDGRSWRTRHEALPLRHGPVFEQAAALERPMARTARLDLGVDAAPPTGTGWGRIVQDMLDAAPAYWFRGQRRFDPRTEPFGLGRRLLSGENAAGTSPEQERRARRRVFVIVQVGFGPQGVLD
jgi:hypothetical protein